MSDHDTPEVGGGLSEYDLTPDERGAIISGRVGGHPVGVVAAACRVFADRLAAVEAERDEAREKATWWERTCTYWNEQATEAQRFRDMNAARAESAEVERDTALREVAERDARLAKVEAVADEWDSRAVGPFWFVAPLRAALANPDGGGQ